MVGRFFDRLQAVALDPACFAAWHAMAEIYFDQDKLDKALEDYGKVYNTNTKNNFTNVALLEAAQIKIALSLNRPALDA